MSGLARCRELFLWALLFLLAGQAWADEVSVLGVTQIPGDAWDKSGLIGTLDDGSPADRFGGLSGIAPLGQNRYLCLSDRGPGDGGNEYRCRVHVAQITLHAATRRLEFRLLKTVLLTDERKRPLVGLASLIDPSGRKIRFDPEGVAVSHNRTFFLSEEYGPVISEFDGTGRRLRSLDVPASFRPSLDASGKLETNQSGRVPNRGLEGLTLSPDGSRLYAALQSPLVQDGGRHALDIRLLEIDLRTLVSRQLVYRLDDFQCGISEILAWGDHALIVLERDNQPGAKARIKRLYQAELSGAKDVSGIDSLIGIGSTAIEPMSKRLLVDLLGAEHRLAGTMPPKLEGLAFGPTLADGRRMLLITSDNDFRAERPTWIYALAIPAGEPPRLQARSRSKPQEMSK